MATQSFQPIRMLKNLRSLKPMLKFLYRTSPWTHWLVCVQVRNHHQSPLVEPNKRLPTELSFNSRLTTTTSTTTQPKPATMTSAKAFTVKRRSTSRTTRVDRNWNCAVNVHWLTPFQIWSSSVFSECEKLSLDLDCT